MTSAPLAHVFLVASNAGLQIGFCLFLAAAARTRAEGERTRIRQILSAAALPAAFLVPLAGFLVPTLSFSFLTPGTRAMQVTPQVSGAAAGGTVENIPAILTPILSPIWSWAGAVWLVGAAALVLRLALGIVAAGRIGKNAAAVRDQRILTLFRETAQTAGCHRPVELLIGQETARPTSLGLIRAAVLLPAETAAWTEEELRPLLRHELAHIKHHDHVRRVATRFLCAIAWFNPLAWIALKRLIVAQEIECDRAAVRGGTPPSLYAGLLLKILRGENAPILPAMASLDSGNEMKARLRAVLGEGQPWKERLLPILLVPALAFFSFWDAASASPKTVTMTRLRSGSAALPPEAPIGGNSQIWLDPDTHRWGWY